MTVRYFSLLSVVMPSLRGRRRKQRPRGRQRRIPSKSAPAVLRSPRRGKRKQWDEDAMLAALEAIRIGCSINSLNVTGVYIYAGSLLPVSVNGVFIRLRYSRDSTTRRSEA